MHLQCHQAPLQCTYHSHPLIRSYAEQMLLSAPRCTSFLSGILHPGQPQTGQPLAGFTFTLKGLASRTCDLHRVVLAINAQRLQGNK